VSGKNNKILPIPETMQGISTSAESKEERSKKKKKKLLLNPKYLSGHNVL
jgi:predicted alternative tryptophan synthase beta-subunit